MEFLKATITSIEKEEAILKFSDGQTLKVPTENLKGFLVGDTVSLNFYNDIDSKEQRQKILKGILNEIISQDSEKTDNQ